MVKRKKILVVDDQKQIRTFLAKFLTREGYDVIEASTPEEGLKAASDDDLLLAMIDLDFGSGREEGLDLLQDLKERYNDLPVVIFTGKGSTETAVKAMKLGASDFLEKDECFADQLTLRLKKAEEFVHLIEKCMSLEDENLELSTERNYYRDQERKKYAMVGESTALMSLMEKVEAVASIPRPVLVLGERGSGKELVAAAIHYRGNRASKPFITINCAAFHGNLLESEMFGYEKGAFTGADERKIGRFEMADTGTLFFDEIGNMATDFQQKVLRVIEYQEFQRVQGRETVKVDVRVVAATNADLKSMIKESTFRADLYDRLSFEVLEVPPLRQRMEDIPLLVNHFVERISDEAGIKPAKFSREAIDALQKYAWPGNVRELRNITERLACRYSDKTVKKSDLPTEIFEIEFEGKTFEEKIANFEKSLIIEGLDRCNGVQKKAAEYLGLTYDQFRHYYKKYGLKDG